MALGCAGEDELSEGEKACEELAAKLEECRLVTQSACNSEALCSVRCAIDAECSQLSEPRPSGSYLACAAGCSGANPGDFICADARGFVAPGGVCDGLFQCLDGSDEASCDGGTADAGGS